MTYQGSCHCGAVTFTVDTDPPAEAMTCNCSHCARKGLTLTFVPAAQFTLESGQDHLRSYEFHKHRIEHQFCATCGTQPFAASTMPDGTEMRAVNLRCVPTVDIDALTITKVDGASF